MDSTDFQSKYMQLNEFLLFEPGILKTVDHFQIKTSL